MEKIESTTKLQSGCFPKLNHSSTHKHQYHAAQGVPETTSCPQPTGAQEGAAVVEAWNKFNTFADTYCAAGNSACNNPKKCKPTIAGHSSKTGAIVREFSPTPGTNPVLGNLKCFVTIETSATVTCDCS